MKKTLFKLYPLSIDDIFVSLLTIPIGTALFLVLIVVLIFAPFPDLMLALVFLPFIALGVVGIYYLKNKSFLIADFDNDRLNLDRYAPVY